MVKLTDDIVKEIRYGKYKDLSDLKLSEILSVAESTIRSVKNRKTWREI